MARKSYIALVVTAGLAVVIAWYLGGPGGLPLTTLTPANFAPFTRSFDDGVDETRVVLLLSPT